MENKEDKSLTVIKDSGDLITQATASIAKIKSSLSDEAKAVLKSTVAKDATDEELSLFVHIANSRGLNPFNRQIHFIKRKMKDEKGEWVEVPTIQTGIDGLRLIAERTKKYMPSAKEPIFHYKPNKEVESCTCFIMKWHNESNQWLEFSHTVFFDEYVQKKKDGTLNRFWRTMPRSQITKCAEAGAIRKGFPEETSGLYIHEEMEQADNSITASYKVISEETVLAKEEDENPVVAAAKARGAKEVPPETEYRQLSKSINTEMLDTCWVHHTDWTTKEFGGRLIRSHKQDDSWCKFNDIIKDITTPVATEYGLDTPQKFTEYIKSIKDGRTWSQIGQDEQLEVLAELENKTEDKRIGEK